MNLNTYYHNMGTAKGLAVLALILIIACWVVHGYCHTFDMDYSGPGSEIERFREEARDNRNREASEHVAKDTAEQRESRHEDKERAADYARDHAV